ncbi:MAG: LysM peptidoglycan-binding domain-containing protein, partial [Arenimonas sp.]
RGKDPVSLRKMNPGYRSGRVVAGVPRLVLAPPGSGAPLALAGTAPPAGTMMAMSLDEPAPARPSATMHKVRSGESLWSIAHFYHLPIEQLRRANRLGSKSHVRPGQMLRLLP